MATIIVTGATDGLGRAIALRLAQEHHALLVHGRSAEKLAELVGALTEAGASRATAYRADFARLADIRLLATRILDEEARIDRLINNAGVGILAERRDTEDGYELAFQVNCLAADLLTRSLAPLLAGTPQSAVVNIASAGQWPLDLDDILTTRGWSGPIAYGRSKLAQIMSTFTLADTLAGVACNAIHPASLMPTKMLPPQLAPASTIETGVRNVLTLALSPAAATGGYFHESQAARAHAQAYDSGARQRLSDWIERHAPTAN